MESRLGSTPEVEREFQAITRGLDTARAQFDQMLEQCMNSEMEAAAITGGAADRFVLAGQPAVPWQPASPKRVAIIVIGLILAAILALGTAIFVEMVDSRVRGAGDIRRLLGRSPLAVVPEIHNSVYWKHRARRLVTLVGSTVIAAPILYLVVRQVAG
jgi:hypothetical protein